MALKPKRLVADTAYGGTGKFLGWLIGVKPLWDSLGRGHLVLDASVTGIRLDFQTLCAGAMCTFEL
jgi:hypothetical protein